MKSEKYGLLTAVHILNRIWCNDLEIALHEVNFWEDLLISLDVDIDAVTSTHDDTRKTELGRLHHFRRLVKRLLEEIQNLDKQMATRVCINHVLDTDTRLNHQYLREEMDSFQADFRIFKTEIRQYVTAQPTF
ncbi:hypothetical protein G8759_22210 [Spirosoma aureum]|uniref:Uncharacterized protein n=1 Tax=Spirosoma aureum TaxID=2692134 RepID=A0A6G9ARM5_9BACT|nr:hypothetical protein [Spirosoma aureum]QIP15142.1 hypothetical protein G8759_22210 [Spirosoma aureum]